jgi:hypothetical protein
MPARRSREAVSRKKPFADVGSGGAEPRRGLADVLVLAGADDAASGAQVETRRPVVKGNERSDRFAAEIPVHNDASDVIGMAGLGRVAKLAPEHREAKASAGCGHLSAPRLPSLIARPADNQKSGGENGGEEGETHSGSEGAQLGSFGCSGGAPSSAFFATATDAASGSTSPTMRTMAAKMAAHAAPHITLMPSAPSAPSKKRAHLDSSACCGPRAVSRRV